MERKSNVLGVIVSAQNVSLSRTGKKILQHINWNINKKEHWVLFGQNGSGKTMLLKVLMGYEWPSNGHVTVLGKKFGETDLRELRKTIGHVSSALQNEFQQQLTAFDVVLSGHYASIGLYDSPSIAVKQKAQKLMQFMEIETKKDQLFPLLSFGEQRRVLIARSLMHDPKLLILDEPCSGLDIKAREHFLSFIEKLGQQKNGPTIILVTHHVEEIMPCFTHMLCLKDGKEVIKGKKEEVLTSEVMNKVLDISLKIEKSESRYYAHIQNI